MKAALALNQFEEIILNPSKYPEWYTILINHVEVDLNLSQHEIEELETDVNSVLFHFINSTGGKFCMAYDESKTVEEIPSIIYFDESLTQTKKGALIIDHQTYEVPFKLNYAKALEKESNIEIQALKGWRALFHQKRLTSNALILNDSYIFDDQENKTFLGSKNIIHLFDSILPDDLEVPYHILINTTTSKNKTASFYNAFVPQLISNIEALRNYEIIIEIVVGEGFHKRKLYTNFLNVTTDKGFKVFDGRNEAKVLAHNDVLIETMFTRYDPFQGDTQYDEMKIRIKELRKLIMNALDWVNGELYNETRSFYYSNLKQEERIEIKNRLVKMI